jgi:hypothetical protein
MVLRASTMGANSRRGSDCSSIYSNQNTWKSTQRSVHMARRSSKETDLHITQTNNIHPNSRKNSQQTIAERRKINSCAPAQQLTTVAPGLHLLWKIQI